MNRFQMILGQTYAGGEYEHVGTDRQAKEVGDTLFAFLWLELGDLDGTEMLEADRRMVQAKSDIDDVLNAVRFDVYSKAIEPMTKAEAWDYMADNIHMDDALWGRLKEVIQCKPT